MSRRHLLVTGGAGFIGSNFVRYVRSRYPDDVVTTLDKLTYAGNLENLRDLENHPNHRFIQGDIADAAAVERLLKGEPRVDAVINFAAETHVDRSIVDAAAFLRTNVIGTQVLLDTIRRVSPQPLLVHISTDEVYGSIDQGAFSEESPLHPSSPYSASKAGADLLVASYVVTYGVSAVITRSSNNYGPYQYPEKFIPLAITNGLEHEAVPLYGDGLNIRDWLYVEDNCQAVEMILQRHLAKPSQTVAIYNIGAGQEHTNLAVLQTILRALGKPESLIRSVPDRPGHDRRYALACDKLRQIGWSPRRTFEEGLRETISWYREHTEWWKRLKRRAAPHWLPATKGVR